MEYYEHIPFFALLAVMNYFSENQILVCQRRALLKFYPKKGTILHEK